MSKAALNYLEHCFKRRMTQPVEIKDQMRAEIAEQMREYEAKHGPVVTEPIKQYVPEFKIDVERANIKNL